MLDAKQVIQKMKERGFTVTMHSVRNGNEPISITFSPMRLDGTDVSCNVNLKEETFSFIWCVPYSINKLSTPNCGSFFNDEHFHRMYEKIFKHAKILYLELQKEN